MKTWIHFLLTSVLAVASLSAFSQVDSFVRVGGGVNPAVSSDNDLRLIFAIDADVRMPNRYSNDYDRTYFVAVTFSSDGSLTTDLDYLDVQINSLGIGIAGNNGHYRLRTLDTSGYLDATFLNFNLYRNLDLGLDNHYRISLAMVKAGGEIAFNDEKIALFGELGLDLLGIIVNSSNEQVDRMTPWRDGLRTSFAFHLQAGIELFRQFRIEGGFRFDGNYAGGQSYPTGRTRCRTVETFWGFDTICEPETRVRYSEASTLSRTYLALTQRITDRLNIRAEGRYNVYRYNDVLTLADRSRESQWQFIFSLVYQF